MRGYRFVAASRAAISLTLATCCWTLGEFTMLVTDTDTFPPPEKLSVSFGCVTGVAGWSLTLRFKIVSLSSAGPIRPQGQLVRLGSSLPNSTTLCPFGAAGARASPAEAVAARRSHG